MAFALKSVAQQAYRQLTNLPTVYIETEGHRPVADKYNYVRATMHYVDENGVKTYDALGIRGRGNSTWSMPKKPYRIKFDSKVELLGPDRAKAKSWTLLANYADKTLIRNAVASYVGSFAGQPFTAAAQFVDLVFNGQYQGNYQISDQIEVRKKRVEITEQDAPASATSNITGGYLLEVDGLAPYEPAWFRTSRGVPVTIKSPDDDIIATSQRQYIASYFQKFEDALFSSDYMHPQNGYRQYVDSLTLASWYISTELTANVDGFWSTNMYKEKDDPKLYWGPLWDYDIAFNNCNRIGDVTHALMRDRAFGTADMTGLWVGRMWTDPWFVNLISRHWKECVDRGFESHVISYIDSLAAAVDRSQQLNFSLWPLSDRVYNEIVLFSTYMQGVDYLKAFLHNHFAFLSSVFVGEAPRAEFEADEAFYYRILNKGNAIAIGAIGESFIGLRCNPSDDDEVRWSVEPCSDVGYYRIVDARSGLAITDNAPQTGSSFTTGTSLGLSAVDDSDMRQQWSIRSINADTVCVVVNRFTDLAWNNSGGSSDEANPIISWNNDSGNISKPTRQWIFTKDSPKHSSSIGSVGESPVDYAVTYDRTYSTLRFIAYGDVHLAGSAEIYSVDGSLVLKFPVQSSVDVSSLVGGLYVLRWNIDGRTHTVKFVR